MNVYEIVTNRIIESLEQGIIPWKRPWTSGDTHPHNLVTRKPYRGVNVLLLGPGRFASPFWLTFRQALSLGGAVQKGAEGTPIVFWKIKNGDAADEGDADNGRRFILRYYTVFNAEQCEGIDIPVLDPPIHNVEPIAHCENIIAAWHGKPTLYLDDENQAKAFYRRDTDAVYMPIRNRFTDAAHFYGVLFHELAHATGHEKRLNRTHGERLADELYSKEELVAEIGSAFLCAVAGISNEAIEINAAAYVQNWISVLKADSRMVVLAAAQAQKAVDLILGTSVEGLSEEEAAAVASGVVERAA
jgi:antirestriction protein ArdC